MAGSESLVLGENEGKNVSFPRQFFSRALLSEGLEQAAHGHTTSLQKSSLPFELAPHPP